MDDAIRLARPLDGMPVVAVEQAVAALGHDASSIATLRAAGAVGVAST